MKKSELMTLVGRQMEITFWDDRVVSGILGYADDFSEKHDYRKPDYFYIGNWSFKISHVKKIVYET